MPSRNLVLLILATLVSMVCYRTASRSHYGGLLADAIGEIDEKFVREVDRRDLFEGAMDGMVRTLDRYSDYISPEELTAFDEELGQEFGGIGVVVEVNTNTNRLTVLSPLPDTPAYAAGMRAGDQILGIDGESTEGFQIRDAVDLMRGEPGSRLVVTVLHEGDTEPIDMDLERAIIPIASVLGDIRNADGTWQFRLESDPDIGYIRLASFGEKTSQELSETIQSLQADVKGLIIDLRGNGGGLLNSAVAICDQFIDEGAIVSIRGRGMRDSDDYFASSKKTVVRRDLPVVLLIDGYSASASEIMAACLQDHDRATVVGTRSWGKGTVQTVMFFEGGRSRLKLTVASYWRPNGKNIHRHVDATPEDPWGVTPNPGYAVETDTETLGKIVKLRRARDRVNIRKDPPEDETSMEDMPAPLGEESLDANGDEQPVETDPGIQEFQDPQLQRAIEAVREQMNRVSANTKAA